jgi:hypothetical protein
MCVVTETRGASTRRQIRVTRRARTHDIQRQPSPGEQLRTLGLVDGLRVAFAARLSRASIAPALIDRRLRREAHWIHKHEVKSVVCVQLCTGFQASSVPEALRSRRFSADTHTDAGTAEPQHPKQMAHACVQC